MTFGWYDGRPEVDVADPAHVLLLAALADAGARLTRESVGKIINTHTHQEPHSERPQNRIQSAVASFMFHMVGGTHHGSTRLASAEITYRTALRSELYGASERGGQPNSVFRGPISGLTHELAN